MARTCSVLVPDELDSDRWLMQTVVELSSSDQARKAATAWLAAYDTTLAEGGDPDGAHAYADVAYGVAATRVGLPVTGRRAA